MSYLVAWLLNLIYLAVLGTAAPWILWSAARTGKYREGLLAKFLGLVPRRDGNAPCVWIHAVSLGEVSLMASTIRELSALHPEWEIVVSTTSKTGYDLARKKYAHQTVFYCPLDFSWAVRRAMQRIRPSLLVLAELELWPNLVFAAKGQGAQVAIINGRLSDKSFPRYRRIRPLVAHVLRRIDLIAAQSEESAERFCQIGAPRDCVHVTGSLKYDGAQTDRNNPRTVALRQLIGFSSTDIVFLAGSTQDPEEQMAVDIYRSLVVRHPRLRLVIVPRHPERFEAVASMLADSGLPWLRRSALREFAANEPANRLAPADRPSDHRTEVSKTPTDQTPPAREHGGSPTAEPSHSSTSDGCGDRSRPILLVDTVGELSAWWGTATVAFVGGTFGSRGGQNMIEPAAYGAAVSFGPNTWNFRDIVATLRAAGGATIVSDAAELESFVRRCLEEPAFATAIGQRAQALVQSQLGATRRTIELIDAALAKRRNTIQKSTNRSAA